MLFLTFSNGTFYRLIGTVKRYGEDLFFFFIKTEAQQCNGSVYLFFTTSLSSHHIIRRFYQFHLVFSPSWIQTPGGSNWFDGWRPSEQNNQASTSDVRNYFVIFAAQFLRGLAKKKRKEQHWVLCYKRERQPSPPPRAYYNGKLVCFGLRDFGTECLPCHTPASSHNSRWVNLLADTRPSSQRSARSLLLSGHFTTATTNRSTGTKCVTLGDLAQQTLDLIPHPTYLPVNCLNALCKRLDWLTKRSLDSSGWKPFLGPRQLLKADSSFGVRKWKAWQRFIENGTVRASRKHSTNKQGCCLRILMI